MNNRGRPKQGEVVKKTGHLHIIVPQTIINHPVMVALKKEKKMGEVIRALIEKYIKENFSQ